jgi:hypothetical protein
MASVNVQASPVMQPRRETSAAGVAESDWRWLYRIGATAALFSVLMIPIQLIVFSSVPEPTTAVGWFALFQNNRILGLLSFEVLFVVNAAFGVTTTLALYAALRRTNPSIMAIALALGVVGTVCIIIARPAMEMLYLSDQHAAATSDAQRSLFLAAGESMVAMRHGTTFHVSYNLANIGLILVPLVMLQSQIFSRTTAYAGILSGVVGFGLYVPTVGIFISVLSVLFYAVFLVLVARKLFQLGRLEGETISQQSSSVASR